MPPRKKTVPPSATTSKTSKRKTTKKVEVTPATPKRGARVAIVLDSSEEDRDSDSEVERVPQTTSSQKSAKKSVVVEVPVLNERQRRKVAQTARSFIDDEAVDATSAMDVEGDEDDDDGFIDDRNEDELSVEDDGETAETAEEGEEETLGEWQTVVADSVQPDTKPAIGRSTGDTIDDDNAGSPITIRNRRKAKVLKAVRSEFAERSDHETKVECLPTTKDKGKGKVVVMEVDHKIVVPSSNPKIKTEPLPQEEPKLDAGHNPFLEEDQRALVDELEELIHPSDCAKAYPNSRSFTEKLELILARSRSMQDQHGAGSAIDSEDENPSPRKKMKVEPEGVMESPVSGLSRTMKTSTIKSEPNTPTKASSSRSGKVNARTPIAGTRRTGTGAVKTEPGTSVNSPPVDVVSNVDDPTQRKAMCNSMVDTYQGILAPPVLRTLHTLLICYNPGGDCLVSFKGAMNTVGYRSTSAQFKLLKSVTIQAAFGTTLFNLSRIDPLSFECSWSTHNNYRSPTFHCFDNMTGSAHFNADAAIGFVMFGSVEDCNLQESSTLTSRDGRVFYRRQITIRPVTMEMHRAFNALAEIWGVNAIGANFRNHGISFSTSPSSRPYPDEPQGTSVPSSSRANADPTEEAEADSEAGDEPDLTLPSSGSVGLVSSDGLLSHDCQSEIRQMVIQGNVWTSARVPIYDLTSAVRGETPPACNQESLSGANEWTNGEIPRHSYVCIHYIPSWFEHNNHKDVQFNLLRVVILSTPPDPK